MGSALFIVKCVFLGLYVHLSDIPPWSCSQDCRSRLVPFFLALWFSFASTQGPSSLRTSGFIAESDHDFFPVLHVKEISIGPLNVIVGVYVFCLKKNVVSVIRFCQSVFTGKLSDFYNRYS